jgi:extradiol dioxygenase family protein
MKRMHIHLSVDDLDKNIKFYTTMFGAEPTIQHSDYAKWRLEDPSVNFAVSDKGRDSGLNHLGLELDSDEELEKIHQRINQSNLDNLEEKSAQCCYSESDKYWTLDPQGIAWENFYTLGEIPIYGANSSKDSEDSLNSCGISKAAPSSQSNCC